MIWFVQVRRPTDVADRLIPLTKDLPNWDQFEAAMKQNNIELPSDFKACYFNPCIAALERLKLDKEGWTWWPHCGFKCGDTFFSIQAWGDHLLMQVYKDIK